MLPPFVQRYLNSRTLQGPWRLEGCTRRGFDGAVVIPALAEEDHLFDTLASLAACEAPIRERFLVIVVVNNRADAPAHDRENNRRTLRRLWRLDALPLAWVDACSEGAELPVGEGVGAARKIGCDLALECLKWGSDPAPLAFLDADTLVEPGYLGAVLRHFRGASRGAAVVPFAHQSGETAAHHRAVVRYELYLRAYVLGLSLARSPYAYHTVGSTIVCRADAYVRAGGMNRRRAGEDFYFLQQMAKTCGVDTLRGTIVRPSARASARTPFGTGPSIARQLAGEEIAFYHPGIFTLLGEWLGAPEPDPLDAARRLRPEIVDFLAKENFPHIWERLRRTHREHRLRHAFHEWFDALKTLRLIHHLSDGSFPRSPWHRALPPLLERAGLRVSPDDEEAILQSLRRAQGA